MMALLELSRLYVGCVLRDLPRHERKPITGTPRKAKRGEM